MSYSRNKSRTFVKINTVERIDTAINYTLRTGYPTLITSAPGMGKTTALREYAKNTNAVYCEINQTTKSTKWMYEMLIEAHGHHTDKQYTSDIGRLCYRYLADYYADFPCRTPLIIDEYQTLEPKNQRELLSLQERCDIPLVLSGNNERLAGKKEDRGALKQIESRIAMHIQLDRPTSQDCERLAVAFNVEGVDAYAALSRYGCKTSVRELVRVLEECERLVNGAGGIRLHHVEAALFGLSDGRETLARLSADA
jgi:DNA transposition AAA+ family ATPase